MVSNGYIERKPLEALLPYIDAWNIDLKGFSEDFYRSQCSASLNPVLDTITIAAAVSHVEVTTLIIPGKMTMKNKWTMKPAGWQDFVRTSPSI